MTNRVVVYRLIPGLIRSLTQVTRWQQSCPMQPRTRRWRGCQSEKAVPHSHRHGFQGQIRWRLVMV